MSSAAEASWSMSAEEALEKRGWIAGEVVADGTAHELRAGPGPIVRSLVRIGPSAGLGRIEGGISDVAPAKGIPLRGEYIGEVLATLCGGTSGDTDAEYVLPWTSPRNSGDVGDRGAAGNDGGASGLCSPGVLRPWIHCSR